MRLFACTSCGQTVYFDSHACEGCAASLGFMPDTIAMVALSSEGDAAAGPERYFRCGHRARGCNWLVNRRDGAHFCVSCRLNRTIPDLSAPGNVRLWQRLEQEKRRLIYSLLRLGLPFEEGPGGIAGLAFDFLADPDQGGGRVMTGHAGGLITLNIAEADPVARERNRSELNEPYRTILGHFRHESGHYFWDRFVRTDRWLAPFRELFGDERADYAQALQRHYQSGPLPDWREHHVSAYASVHPWEDWAETWSHYLHMVDTLETAWVYGLAIEPRHTGGEVLAAEPAVDPYEFADFQTLISQWMPLTVALNSLSRSMGHEAAYPFALATPVIEKLGFVHRVVRAAPPAG